LNILTINQQRYNISPKLLLLQNGESPVAPAISSYNVEKTVDALKTLGFDFTENRIQGKEIVRSEIDSYGTIHIKPSWIILDDIDTYNGISTIKLKDDRFLEKVIRPWYKNPEMNIIRIHEWSRFNTRLTKTYSYLPEALNRVINKIHGKAVSLNQHRYAKCIMFDIDNHEYKDMSHGRSEADRTLNHLYETLGYAEEAFIEQSVTGGYHVAFLTDDVVNDEDTKLFVKEFNLRFNADLEVRLTTKIFRLPNHFTYTTGYTRIEDGKIIFIPFTDNINSWKKKVLTSKDRLIYSMFFVKAPELEVKTTTKTYRRARTYTENVLMTAGNRDKAMWKTACSMMRAGYTIDDYYMKLCESNISSVDWTAWDASKRLSEATRFWNNASKYVDRPDTSAATPSSFISSKNLLPKEVLKLTNNPILTSFLNKDAASPYLKIRDRSFVDTKNMIEEMIGKAIYEEINPRIAIVGSAATKYNLEQGYQFSRKFIDMAGTFHNMQSSARRIANHLMAFSGIFNMYEWNGKTGRYASTGNLAFCRQWIPAHAVDIVTSFIKFATSIIKMYSSTIILRTPTHGNYMCAFCNLEVTFPINQIAYPPPD